MKFFHVYNEDCINGLEKNGLLNIFDSYLNSKQENDL